MLAAALAAGLASAERRRRRARRRVRPGRTALIRHPVDLYLVRPLGELAVAAAVLGERDAIAPYLDQARTLLAQLGDPPLWAAPLHWSELHADARGRRPATRRATRALAAS